MANSKKSTKKTTVKAKTAAVKSKTRRASRPIVYQDFRIQKESVPFMTFKLTQQTFYWLILLLLIFALSIWVLDIQLQTNDILNAVEASLSV